LRDTLIGQSILGQSVALRDAPEQRLRDIERDQFRTPQRSGKPQQ
jgi:hypothetical protein